LTSLVTTRSQAGRSRSSKSIWRRVSEKGTLDARIVAQVEHLIRERRLMPGDRLPPERELAALLGVSRPSLREAVKTLEAIGRVRVRHGTGIWIQPPDPMQSLSRERGIGLEELFAMRKVLEVPAAGWAAQLASRDDLRDLGSLIEAMGKVQDVAELERLDIRFHLQISKLAGNRFLSKTMGVLHQMLHEGMVTTLQIPGRRERSRLEHKRILNALVSRDVPAAKRAAQAHIEAAEGAALRRIAEEQILNPSSPMRNTTPK